MPRASQKGRRMQARMNFYDSNVETWHYLQSIPEGGRTHELHFLVDLGVRVRKTMLQLAARAEAGTLVFASSSTESVPVKIAPSADSAGLGARAEMASGDEMRDWDPMAGLDLEGGAR